MNVKTILKTIQTGAKVSGRFLEKNLPNILMVLGTAGVVGGTVMAVKKAPAAKEALDEVREEWNEIEDKEKRNKADYIFKLVRIGTRYYWTVALVVGGSISCFWVANHINLKRLSAALTAVAISRENLKDLEDKIVEMDGEKKLTKYRDEIAKDRVQKSDVDLDNVYGVGEHLCYDSIGKHYFMSDIEKIKRAERMVKEDLRDQLRRGDNYAFVPLSDFLEWCGDQSGFGDLLGFQVEALGCDMSADDLENLVEEAIDISGGSALKDGSIPVFVINYDVTPKYAYDLEGWRR